MPFILKLKKQKYEEKNKIFTYKNTYVLPFYRQDMQPSCSSAP